MAPDADARGAFRHAMLAGEVAQRQGRLDEAEDLVLMLAMLEVLGRAECFDVRTAAAVRVTEHMNDVARAAGLDTLVINSIAVQTDALLAAGREYHPLRHRNTVYVAVKRLRQTLRKLLGPRSVIETAAGGWRMADDIDAVAIRPLDRPSDDGAGPGST